MRIEHEVGRLQQRRLAAAVGPDEDRRLTRPPAHRTLPATEMLNDDPARCIGPFMIDPRADAITGAAGQRRYVLGAPAALLRQAAVQRPDLQDAAERMVRISRISPHSVSHDWRESREVLKSGCRAV
jgi:hypothetical protein